MPYFDLPWRRGWCVVTISTHWAVPMGEDRDEAVHLAVEAEVGGNFAAHGFERAAEVVDGKPGCF